MNIFILEDDLIQQQYFKRIVENYLSKKKGSSALIFETSKPEEILKKAIKNIEYSIYFLDVNINEQEKMGFELAKKIRNLDPFSCIVFITTHSEFMPLTFKYKLMALDYIDKSLDKNKFIERVNECLNIAYEKQNESEVMDVFTFKNKKSNFQIPFSEILFFETTGVSHKIRLVTKNKHSEFYSTLNEVEIADERFFKCHKSYVVNLDNIQEVDRASKVLKFVNDEHCFVSRSKISALLKKLSFYNAKNKTMITV